MKIIRSFNVLIFGANNIKIINGRISIKSGGSNINKLNKSKKIWLNLKFKIWNLKSENLAKSSNREIIEKLKFLIFKARKSFNYLR